MIPISKDTSLPLPPTTANGNTPTVAPSPEPSTPTPVKKEGFLTRAENVGNILGSDVRQGLSYANARRARSTYRG